MLDRPGQPTPVVGVCWEFVAEEPLTELSWIMEEVVDIESKWAMFWTCIAQASD